jgi:hypothetical protein
VVKNGIIESKNAELKVYFLKIAITAILDTTIAGMTIHLAIIDNSAKDWWRRTNSQTLLSWGAKEKPSSC